jgi:hypothetical protein
MARCVLPVFVGPSSARMDDEAAEGRSRAGDDRGE